MALKEALSGRDKQNPQDVATEMLSELFGPFNNYQAMAKLMPTELVTLNQKIEKIVNNGKTYDGVRVYKGEVFIIWRDGKKKTGSKLSRIVGEEKYAQLIPLLDDKYKRKIDHNKAMEQAARKEAERVINKEIIPTLRKARKNLTPVQIRNSHLVTNEIQPNIEDGIRRNAPYKINWDGEGFLSLRNKMWTLAYDISSEFDNNLNRIVISNDAEVDKDAELMQRYFSNEYETLEEGKIKCEQRQITPRILKTQNLKVMDQLVSSHPELAPLHKLAKERIKNDRYDESEISGVVIQKLADIINKAMVEKDEEKLAAAYTYQKGMIDYLEAYHQNL